MAGNNSDVSQSSALRLAASRASGKERWLNAFFQSLGQSYRWLLDLVTPPLCVGCRAVGVWLCSTCAAKIPLYVDAQCPRCGRPWTQNSPCTVCQEHPLQVNPVRSAFLFEEPIRSAIHALKYRGGVQIVEALAEPLALAWRTWDLHSDLLVPVPLHARREARRGYNQAQVLAHALGTQLGLPTASRALQRVRDTTSQTRLNREARHRNVADAFAVFPGLELTGVTVTLVDDVATTGATLNACATVLLEAGAAAVNAFTLARAP